MPGTLFVTRKFPPSVGGMQTLAADVWATLSHGEERSAALVAHGGRNRGLPWFLLRATVATVREVRGGRVDVVLTGDVLMYLVLVVQFRGFLQPLQMIASLPLELAGVFVALWLAGQAFSTVSILGIIVLTGMVIFLASLLFGVRRGLVARLIEHFRFQRQLSTMHLGDGLPEVENA